MTEYKLYSYSDYADALAEIRRQHEAGEPLVWTGPDELHHSVSAGQPPPSWYFSDEGLAYMEERGYDFWDTYTQVASNLGFHQGAVKEEQNSQAWKRMADLSDMIAAEWRSKAKSYEDALKRFEAEGWGPYVRAIRNLMKEK